MQFALTEEQQSIHDLAEQVLGDLVTPDSLKKLDREGRWFDSDTWRQLADSGLLGLAIAEEHDGGGMGLVELAILLRHVGGTVAQVPALETLVAVGLTVARFGDDALKQQLLPRIARGELVATVALSEVLSRDLRQPVATATRNDDGYTLTGAWTNVAYFEQAESMLVAAQTDAGVVLLLVPANESSELTVVEQKGTNDQPLHAVTAQGVHVPASAVVVGPEQGAQALLYVVDVASIGVCALEWGVADKAVRLAAEYTAERKQFGMPLSAFQAVRQRVADAFIDAQAMEVTMWQAAWKRATDQASDRDIAIAKYWAADGGARVLSAAMHVHGGMGADRDYPLFRFFLTSKHLEFTLGSAREHLARLGDIVAKSTL